MFALFYTYDGIVTSIPIPRGKTMTSAMYSEEILPNVFNTFMEKRKRKTCLKLMLHHDNASSHHTNKVYDTLKKFKVKELPHPPYSPDLAPCDFFLIGKIKSKLGGKYFDNEEQLALGIQDSIDKIPISEYEKSFNNWINRLKICIIKEGLYVE